MSKNETMSIERSCDLLVEKLAEWTEMLEIPRLSEYGVTESDIDVIVEKSDNKNNPVELDSSDIRRIIFSRV